MPACAQVPDAPPLPFLLGSAGVAPVNVAPRFGHLDFTSTRGVRFPLFNEVMTQPLRAPYRVGLLAQHYRDASDSPFDMLELTGAVAGLSASPGKHALNEERERLLKGKGDPLAQSLAWMSHEAHGSPWSSRLPDSSALANPLRFEVAMMLTALGRAEQLRQRALAQIPPELTPERLRRQALDGEFLDPKEPDYRNLLQKIDQETLLMGMLQLVAATERLKAYLATSAQLPAVSWEMDTPMGRISIDTTGRDNVYRLKNSLLIIDVGGNDTYEFLPSEDRRRISVLLDHQGNDHYVASTPGTDPSAATLGYGILWDTEGDDRYQGTQHAQASALFGAAMLIDERGTNSFNAISHAQAQAVAGMAILLGGTGNDSYVAQTHAQASAGPQGVAMLLETAGNDSYLLGNTPLVRPSPQSPSRNTSMGQGAGRGIRANAMDGISTTGGIGILIDMAGTDQYVAQVFAQGAGYQMGLGILVDDDGDDQFDAAWYGMGAAAHAGAGILLKRGNGNNRYRASHATSIGAAHDFSVGIFVDEAGNDSYELGDLGLGAAHDNSFSLFVDGGGNDAYRVESQPCRAFGAAHITAWGGLREDLSNVGLFLDLGGTDTYPARCSLPRNNADWSYPRKWPKLQLPSESGAGVDGEFPLPFALRARTH